MTLTLDELKALMPVLDAGVKAAGLQIFQNDGGIHMQSALAKLQRMADEANAKPTEETKGGPAK